MIGNLALYNISIYREPHDQGSMIEGKHSPDLLKSGVQPTGELSEKYISSAGRH